MTVAGADKLHAEFNADTFAGRAEAGYRFATAVGGLTPYAAVEMTSFSLPSYSETATSGSNQFALSYASKTTSNARSEIGARTDKSFKVTDALLTLRMRAAWAHDSDTAHQATATFQTLPGATFTVNGAQPESNSALISASAELALRNGWSVGANFDGEFSTTTRGYAGRGTLRHIW